MARPPLYNRQRIAELLSAAIKDENPYAPYSDSALADLVEDTGERCTVSVVYHLRGFLKIPNIIKRRAAYREKREAIGGLKNGG